MINIVFCKECRSFIGSERGLLFVYAVLIAGWSLLPLAGGIEQTGSLSWLLFSVIISSNFAGPVFVSERLSGAMEVLLTSGLSRSSVLWGKLLFVVGISFAAGACSFALSLVWLNFMGEYHGLQTGYLLHIAALYCAGAVMNSACTAWLSVRLRSPRTVPLTGILLTAIPAALWYVFAGMQGLPEWILVAALARYCHCSYCSCSKGI